MKIYITAASDFDNDQVLYSLMEMSILSDDVILLSSSKRKDWQDSLESMANRYGVKVIYPNRPEEECDKIIYLENNRHSEVMEINL